MNAIIVECDVATAWGWGVEPCWNGILTGTPAFSPVERFPAAAFQSRLAAQVPGIAPGDESLVMQLLRPLLGRLAPRLPADTLVLLATTTGEVDRLERAVLEGRPEDGASRLSVLLGRVCRECGVSGPGRTISAACASSAAAVAQAAALIRSGERDAVLVVACDAVTEFIVAGFSSLMALDPDGAKPFDRNRRGLTVGEGAGYVLLMSGARATREGRTRLAEVTGWGLSGDANHMTGPSRDGDGLASAIAKALHTAGVAPGAIGAICAHGTGTPYNDAMELKAFRRVFTGAPVPVYSIKGSIGHTMGAAALIELVVTVKSLQAGVVPPSANLRDLDPEAEGWVSPVARQAPGLRAALSTNSGFGGVNAALMVTA